MKALKLLTWLDVRRTIHRATNYETNLPQGVVRIRCFSDALEIGMKSETDKNKAESAVKEWFGDWYQEKDALIHLDFGDATLPVEFISGAIPAIINSSVRPFWEEVVYVNPTSDSGSVTPKPIHFPMPYPSAPKVIAFYSFKGDVGKSLHLSAHLFALLERAKELDKAINILVIDADLEASVLTNWHRAKTQQSSVSFLDFLEAYHSPPVEIEQTLSLFAKEVKKSIVNENKSTLYFLPTCLNDEQLLDISILPEHLVRSLDEAWECGNAIHRLGQAVGADYVFIDVRAGLSKISSPIIFDPRIQRFIVTTMTEQSVRGTRLVLKQMGRVAPPEASNDNDSYFAPALVLSMLTPELKLTPAFEQALVAFQSAYLHLEEKNLDSTSTRLEIKETYFAQELLYVNNWEEARLNLNRTSVMKVAKEWAERELKITN